MEENINKIQMVINTLDGGFKDLPATYHNCATLAACIKYLCEVRDGLLKQKDGEEDGNNNAE